MAQEIHLMCSGLQVHRRRGYSNAGDPPLEYSPVGILGKPSIPLMISNDASVSRMCLRQKESWE